MSERIEAGRETDVLVAEKVMGYFAYRSFYPAYSTDRCAALEVVDRLIAAGIDVEMKATEDGNFVTLTKARTEWKLGSAGAHTLALAISAAALAPEVLAHLASRPTESETQRG